MSTYRQIFYQIVFSTKYREQTLLESFEKEVYKYIHGTIKNMNCKLYRINSMPDHIHIFSDLHPSVCLSDYVKNIKISSNLFIKNELGIKDFYGWQNGYGAFTYNIKEKDLIIDYVKNQKEHHKHETSIDELKRLLLESGIVFDEKYLL